MLNASPVFDAQGEKQPNAFVISDDELSVRSLAEEYIEAHGDQNPDNPEKGRSYRIKDVRNSDKDLLTEYLALEKRQARRAANYLVEEKYFSNGMPIPILYGPDSAIHTAEGIMDGLWGATSAEYRLFPVDRGQPVPEEALEMAKKCGAILFCDSVINYGKVSAGILKSIPSDIKGPDGSSLKVITYFNYATHKEFGTVSYEAYGAEKSVRGLPELRKAVESNGHQHYFFVSEIGDLNHDLFDRADAIACAATKHNKLTFYTDKFFKRTEHGVIEPKERNVVSR